MSTQKLSAQKRGVYLSDEDKTDIFNQYRESDAKDLRRQVKGMTMLKAAGGLLAAAFFFVNAYQGSWALAKLAGTGNGTYVDQGAIIIVAAGLILAANIVAIRMTLSNGLGVVAGVAIVAGLMAFSVVTSAMHVSFSIQSGVLESARSTDQYKLAKERYETAMHAEEAARTSYSDYQASVAGGDPWALNATHSKGPARPYVEAIKAAQAEKLAAGQAFGVAQANGGGAESQIVGKIAGWFGWDTAQFALNFAIFCVVLMELVRVYLSFVAGLYLRELMEELSEEDSDSRKTTVSRQSLHNPSGAAQAGRGGKGAEIALIPTRGRTIAASAHRGESISAPVRDGTPAWKRDAQAQAQLAKVIEGVRSGALVNLGINSVAKYAKCGVDRAKWIVSQLVKKGMAVRQENGRVKVATAA